MVHRTQEIMHVDQFTFLIPVAPKRDRLAVNLAAQNFPDEIEDEMELTTIGMIAPPVKRRRDEREMPQSKLLRERTLSHQHHPLRHCIREKAIDRLAVKIMF